MRMADFQNIQSCHSPDSSYFKCAVAEAQGKGMVSYIVENDDLKNELGEDFDLSDWDTQEIFYDEDRYSASASDLTPVSRVRLRN